MSKWISKCFIAQMDAMKIASIISEHGETNVLDGDNVIAGLVYRLMNLCLMKKVF